MMKPGVTLIELLLALFIGSLLMVALYNSYSLTNRVVDKADTIMSYDIRLATILDLFNRDLGSATIPRYEGFEEEEPQEKGKKIDSHDTKKPIGKPAPKKPAIKKKQAKLPTIKKLFFADQKKSMISHLTFITSNSFLHQIKDDKKVGSARLSRVYYQLVPEKDHENSFALYRQEGLNLDAQLYAKKESKIRRYEVARGIKSLSFTFSYPAAFKKVPKVDDKPGEFKTANSWQRDNQNQRSLPAIPQFATLNLELWDERYNQSQSISFIIEIASFYASVFEREKKKPQKKEAPKKIGSDSLKNLSQKMMTSLGNKMPVLKIKRA